MRYITLLLLLTFAIFAKNLFISSDSAKVNVYNPKIGEFLGHVKVKKDKDRLNSNKLYVYFRNKRPIKYVALENIKFKVYMNNKIYVGVGDSVTFHPKENKYVVEGNAVVESDKERLTGDILTLQPDKKSFEANMKDDGPIKLIIDVNNE